RFARCIAELDLEVIDPVQEASPLPATQEGAVSDADSDAVKAAADAYPIAIKSWWSAHRKI
ncbi:MAG: hypothetical protein GY887_12640, partial [Halieaceae bacterium]|nr:hypothetical protein [Halieaceae bacterium]